MFMCVVFSMFNSFVRCFSMLIIYLYVCTLIFSSMSYLFYYVLVCVISMFCFIICCMLSILIYFSCFIIFYVFLL